jgi:hypothetical protein
MTLRRARRGRDEAKTSLYLPRSLLRAARMRAAADEVSLREVVVRALAAYLGQPGKRRTDESK